MGKPNFSFQKRQKELAKKKKSEEKKQRKLEKHAATPDDNPAQPHEEGDSASEPVSELNVPS